VSVLSMEVDVLLCSETDFMSDYFNARHIVPVCKFGNLSVVELRQLCCYGDSNIGRRIRWAHGAGK
jgi:hypothetical protein